MNQNLDSRQPRVYYASKDRHQNLHTLSLGNAGGKAPSSGKKRSKQKGPGLTISRAVLVLGASL